MPCQTGSRPLHATTVGTSGIITSGSVISSLKAKSTFNDVDGGVDDVEDDEEHYVDDYFTLCV